MRVGSVLSGEHAFPARLRPSLFVVAAVGAVALVVLGVLVAGDTTGAPVDRAVRDGVLHLNSPWRQIALIIDYFGEPVGATVMFVVLVVVFVRLGQRRAAVLVVAGPGLTVAVTTALKPLVGREINGGFLAYPSGHTATAAAVALVVTMTAVKRAPVTWTLAVTTAAALAMAWAQVLLNAHYPTDTAGGFAAALAVVPPTAWLIDRVARTPAAPAGRR